MVNDPDQELVTLAKRGDKAAFGKLVAQYHDLVYAVAFGVLGEREEALDATQDVFIKIFQELEHFQGQSKFKTWLYRISVNAAIDAARKRRPTEPIEEEANFEAKNLSPRAEASQREIRELIEKALSSLNPEHRAVLVLREWHELSYEEIAETLQIEMGTVMSRLFYARKKLAEIIGVKFGELKP